MSDNENVMNFIKKNCISAYKQRWLRQMAYSQCLKLQFWNRWLPTSLTWRNYCHLRCKLGRVRAPSHWGWTPTCSHLQDLLISTKAILPAFILNSEPRNLKRYFHVKDLIRTKPINWLMTRRSKSSLSVQDFSSRSFSKMSYTASTPGNRAGLKGRRSQSI